MTYHRVKQYVISPLRLGVVWVEAVTAALLSSFVWRERSQSRLMNTGGSCQEEHGEVLMDEE